MPAPAAADREEDRDEGVAAPMPPTTRSVPRVAWRETSVTDDERTIPEETAIAITYNGSTQAVMMATPADLEDFAVGFSLTERIVGGLKDIQSIEIVPLNAGVEVRLWIAEPYVRRLSERRRAIAGPSGCGLCGIDSLAEVMQVAPTVASNARFAPDNVFAAFEALSAAQSLNRETHAVHAAGFWRPADGLVCAREDLGRHNAMDKLVGAMARAGRSDSDGIALVTSRISVEIVQKAAVLGAPVLAAVSAPTALAVRTAEHSGICLVGVAREDGFEIFTCPERIEGARR
jgi:FdhD protein